MVELIWQFLFCVILYLFALTGVDHMITGVIKPDIDKRIFLAYGLWQTLLNQATALFAPLQYWNSNPNPSVFLAVLMYVTVVWCWVGGALDFLYFMMKGYILEPNVVWYWMPFKPKTWQFAIYSLIWLIIIVTSWIYVLVV